MPRILISGKNNSRSLIINKKTPIIRMQNAKIAIQNTTLKAVSI